MSWNGDHTHCEKNLDCVIQFNIGQVDYLLTQPRAILQTSRTGSLWRWSIQYQCLVSIVEYILLSFQCRSHMLLVIGHIMRKLVLVESLQKGADQNVYLYSQIGASIIYLLTIILDKPFEPWHEISDNLIWRRAKAQTSLRIRAVWSEPLLDAWKFYEC